MRSSPISPWPRRVALQSPLLSDQLSQVRLVSPYGSHVRVSSLDPLRFPAVAVGGARFRRARGVFARASRRRTAHPRGDRVVPRVEGQGLCRRGLAHPGGAPEGAAAAGVLPDSLDYRVPAVLHTYPDRQTMEMPTSTGQLRTMVRVGRLDFSLRGQQLGLGAFVEAGSQSFDRLFVPFTDLTSGTETYPAGRYIDLDRTRDRHLHHRLQPRLSTRTATTTRPTTARTRRVRTGCRCRYARARA